MKTEEIHKKKRSDINFNINNTFGLMEQFPLVHRFSKGGISRSCKRREFFFRNLDFYVHHGESTSTAS